MSVALTLNASSLLREIRTFSGEGVSPADNTITVDQLSTTETLNSGSTPPITKSLTIAQALTAGSATLDVTNAVDAISGATVTLTGLKPAYMKLQNPATNANPITIVFGAVNGYTGFGAGFNLTLPVGGEVLLRLGAIVFDATHKTFDLTGTGAQVLNIQILAG
jgi:hypothetical protein